MEEKQIIITESQLNVIVDHAFNAILYMSGEKDIAISTVYAATIIKIADEISGGAISSKDILDNLQESIKQRTQDGIKKILDKGLKDTLKLKDHGN